VDDIASADENILGGFGDSWLVVDNDLAAHSESEGHLSTYQHDFDGAQDPSSSPTQVSGSNRESQSGSG
jgi:hypothetical protein